MISANYKILRLRGNDSGIILIVVLWILIILTLLAVGLGRRIGIDLEITQYGVGELRARYAALAGLVYAVGKVKEDTKSQEFGSIDTKYLCGFIKNDEQGPESIFSNRKVGTGTFEIRFLTDNQNGTGTLGFGFTDEESKININALTRNNYKIFANLLEERGLSVQEALAISSAAMDWIDADSEMINDDGAEIDYYASLTPSVQCKNAPLESIEELLLVKGMTPEIFKNIKSYITVFPKSGKLLMNMNTASYPALMALARYFTGGITNTQEADAVSLVSKIIAFRAGADGAEATQDDRVVDFNDLNLNAKEKTIFLLMKTHQTDVSQYIRIQVKGIDKSTKIASRIDAVLRRQDSSLLYWRRF